MLILPATAITAALAQLQQGPVFEFEQGGAPRSLLLEGRLGGTLTGGTSIDAYVCTSNDGSAWYDIANFHFLTTAEARLFNLSGLTAETSIITPSAAGSLASNTALDGMLGDFLTVFYKSVGAYNAASLLIAASSPARLRRVS